MFKIFIRSDDVIIVRDYKIYYIVTSALYWYVSALQTLIDYISFANG